MKKSFLIPVAVAAIALSSQDFNNVLVKPKNLAGAELILESSGGQEIGLMTSHASHASHRSHASHASHRSHSSHYSMVQI